MRASTGSRRSAPVRSTRSVGPPNWAASTPSSVAIATQAERAGLRQRSPGA